jgi:hypothetical protein
MGNNTEDLENKFNSLITNKKIYNKYNIPLTCYGTGDTSKKISLIIKKHINDEKDKIN